MFRSGALTVPSVRAPKYTKIRKRHDFIRVLWDLTFLAWENELTFVTRVGKSVSRDPRKVPSS